MKKNNCSIKKMLTFFFAISFAFIVNGNLVEIEENKTIIYVDMVADLFHSGHVEFFKKAKEFGNYLLVGLCSDQDCTSYKRKPVLTLEERVKAVEACSYVDLVVPAVPLIITDEFIDKYQIDFVVHGDDFDKEKLKYYYGVAIDRGIFKT
ncbi:adenylyltransferase/cytidyltransferase family protein, partial [Candidatus Dependentiae bacterium]